MLDGHSPDLTVVPNHGDVDGPIVVLAIPFCITSILRAFPCFVLNDSDFLRVQYPSIPKQQKNLLHMIVLAVRVPKRGDMRVGEALVEDIPLGLVCRTG